MSAPDNPPVAPEVLIELDRRHRVSWDAFDAHDLDACMDFFSPELIWRGIDGRTIGFDSLRRLVGVQFEQGIRRRASSYAREAISVEGPQIVETLTQTSDVTLNAFGIVRRDITLQRRGSYRWSRTSGTWRVMEAEIVSETIKTNRWRLTWPGRP